MGLGWRFGIAAVTDKDLRQAVKNARPDILAQCVAPNGDLKPAKLARLLSAEDIVSAKLYAAKAAEIKAKKKAKAKKEAAKAKAKEAKKDEEEPSAGNNEPKNNSMNVPTEIAKKVTNKLQQNSQKY